MTVFAAHCPDHDTLVLLSLVDLEELRHTPGGIEVRFRCDCGHGGAVVTGRDSRRGRDTTSQGE